MNLLFPTPLNMILVADESVDFGIIDELRQNGFTIISTSEKYSGVKDTEVLKIAVDRKCLLITEDKDFGELVYRLKFEHKGILLIRLNDISRPDRIKIASKAIKKYCDILNNNFSVLNKRGLRIKKQKV